MKALSELHNPEANLKFHQVREQLLKDYHELAEMNKNKGGAIFHQRLKTATHGVGTMIEEKALLEVIESDEESAGGKRDVWSRQPSSGARTTKHNTGGLNIKAASIENQRSNLLTVQSAIN